MDALEKSCEGKWLEWYRLTPLERWHESGRLWAEYFKKGGSLDPEWDPESPFNDDFYPPETLQIGGA